MPNTKGTKDRKVKTHKIRENKRNHGRTRCLYCTAKIAKGMHFCNAEHRARYEGMERATKREHKTMPEVA